MPPFVNTPCANCAKPNRFDLAELSKESGSLMKKIVFRGEEKAEQEFEVTCQHCGRKFKFKAKVGDYGKKNKSSIER
jgi:RNase P subunit RPR2